LVAHGLEPEDLDVERSTLEDVYLALADEPSLSGAVHLVG
jgi:hypothetical protein